MKKIPTYIPVIAVAAVAIAVVYFAWYKPKKDKEAAANAAAQAAADKAAHEQLMAEDPKFSQLIEGLGSVTQTPNNNNAVTTGIL